MSVEKAKEFYSKVSSDETLRADLEKAVSAVEEEKKMEVILDCAQKSGFDITEAELKEYLQASAEEVLKRSREAEQQIQEMRPEELEKVAGGKVRPCNKTGSCDANGRIVKCVDTAREGENCVLTDACNKSFVLYEECGFFFVH